MFLQVCVILFTGGGGIPVCLVGHMTNQHYISSCTVGGSQLVRRQHTGNIKCMMGLGHMVTPSSRWRPPRWRTPLDGEPPGWRAPLDGEPPWMENTPLDGDPPDGEPPCMEKPPWMENPPDGDTPPDGEPPRWRTPWMENPPPPDPGNLHFNCKNTFFKYLHRLMSINVLLT